MAALSKAELVEYLFDTIGVNKREGKLLIEQFFEEIRLSLESGEQVLLSGFGRFNLQDKKERPARNPRTMEDAMVSARRVVKFKPSSVLLQMVQRCLEKERSGKSEGRGE